MATINLLVIRAAAWSVSGNEPTGGRALTFTLCNEFGSLSAGLAVTAILGAVSRAAERQVTCEQDRLPHGSRGIHAGKHRRSQPVRHRGARFQCGLSPDVIIACGWPFRRIATALPARDEAAHGRSATDSDVWGDLLDRHLHPLTGMPASRTASHSLSDFCCSARY